MLLHLNVIGFGCLFLAFGVVEVLAKFVEIDNWDLTVFCSHIFRGGVGFV